jgi:hypothetical protein
MANLGKIYRWSGSNFTKSSSGYIFVIKGTGDTIKMDSSGVSTPADVIISEDLSRYTRCNLQVKATKMLADSAAGVLVDDFGIHAYGFSSDEALTAGYLTGGSGENTVSVSVGASWGAGLASLGEAWFKNLKTSHPDAYNNIAFASSPAGSVAPLKYVGCQFAINFTDDASAHEWQFECQWVYE